MISRAPRSPIANGCYVATALLMLVACSPQTEDREPEREPSEDQPHTPAEVARPPVELEPGQIHEGELASGESRVYLITSGADQYLHAVVDQQGVDVVVTLVGPDGERLLRMDRLISAHGLEPVFAVTRKDGLHQLQVAAREGSRYVGSYTVQLAERRPASETDVARANAASVYAGARSIDWRENPGRAAERFQRAQAAWEELGELSLQGESLVLLGLCHQRMAERQAAAASFQRAADSAESAGDDRLQALALHNLGLVYLRSMDLEPAIRSFREELPLRQKTRSRRAEAVAYHALGQAFQIQDEVQQALDCYAQALDLFVEPEDRLRSIHNRGVLDLSLGRLPQARDALIEAEELAAAVGNLRTQSATLNQLGELHRRLDERETALGYFDQALALRRNLEDRRGEANSLANIGRVLQARGDYAQSLAYYQDALEILDGLEQPWLAARVLLNRGSLHLDQGQSEPALDAFRRSVELYRGVGDPTGEAEGLLGLARAERLRGQLTAARKASEEALRIFETVRPKAVSYDLRTSFFATVQQHLEFHIDLLMELHQQSPERGYDALALEVSEQARARSLLDLLLEAGAEIRRGTDPELLERERAVQRRLNAWEERRYKLHARQRRKQAEAAERTIRQLLEELAEVQAKIRRDHPRYAELKHGQALSADSIRRQVLDEDTLLMEYWLGEERSFLWTVGADSLEAFELPGRHAIEDLARQAYELLTRSHRREARASTRNALCALSREVLAPAADRLAAKRLLIVADGALQYIPFAALPEPGGAGDCSEAEPLVVAHEIVHLPSASTLPILRQGPDRSTAVGRSVAVVADPVFSATDRRVRSSQPASGGGAAKGARSAGGIDPSSYRRLPFSLREADAILDLVAPSERFRAVGFEASKETVTGGQLSGHRFIHFATHGVLDTDNPELSGIVLSGVDPKGRKRDGFLRAHEIYNLDLACDLVVLSACETALGKEVRGEGLIGLTRGFMYAGAARVMVSLWNVSDEGTAELMELFYRGLLQEDLRPAAALRAAQVSMLRSDARAARYYWAGFVIQGDWR